MPGATAAAAGLLLTAVAGLFVAVPAAQAPSVRETKRHAKPVRGHTRAPRRAHERKRVKRASAAGVYAATVAGTLQPADARDPELVYVPATAAGVVDVIDPKRLQVVRRIAAGALPHHVTPSWNLRWLYVDNTVGNSLTVIDPRRGTRVRTIRVGDPYNLYFSPDGRRALVVAERLSRLDFRNPRTWRLIKSVAVPGRGVDHLDFAADGRSLLASDEFSGDLVQVDVRRMRVMRTVHVGGLPVDVRLAPDGGVFYVADQGRGGVWIVSAATARPLRFLRTGAGAHGLCVSRDARSLYVSNRLGGSISVISFARRRVVATWHVGGSPDMLQVSPDGSRLWTTNRYHASVSVVDTRSGRLISVIAVGPGPHGLSYFPQPGRYSVGHNGVFR